MPSLAPCWRSSACGPMDAVYARVRDDDLGKVRRRVTLHTHLYPAAALPAACLPSQMRELSFLAVCMQAKARASKVGISLPSMTLPLRINLPTGSQR